MFVFLYNEEEEEKTMFNEIIVIGRLANKPVMRETQNGIKLATIVLDIERP